LHKVKKKEKRSHQGESQTEKAIAYQMWSITLCYEQHANCMTNWSFYSNCIMPRDRMFDWQYN